MHELKVLDILNFTYIIIIFHIMSIDISILGLFPSIIN